VGIRGANRSYYLFDGLGSVVALTNASGSVTNSYTYDPFGVTTETKALLTKVFNPWRYTGQYQDVTTGLYKMGARYYQPELGRWTQPDPSGLDAHSYVYAGSDPINNSDPTGLFCITGKNPNGSCRSISRAVERAFVPPEGCAIFSPFGWQLLWWGSRS
jgi:RHS repeat-associated protein